MPQRRILRGSELARGFFYRVSPFRRSLRAFCSEGLDLSGPSLRSKKQQGFPADSIYGNARCLPMLGSLKTGRTQKTKTTSGIPEGTRGDTSSYCSRQLGRQCGCHSLTTGSNAHLLLLPPFRSWGYPKGVGVFKRGTPVGHLCNSPPGGPSRRAFLTSPSATWVPRS